MEIEVAMTELGMAQAYRRALRNGIVGECMEVVHRHGDDHGPVRRWQHDGVIVERDYVANVTTAWANNRLVMTTRYGAQMCVPGPWIEMVKEAASQRRGMGDEE